MKIILYGTCNQKPVLQHQLACVEVPKIIFMKKSYSVFIALLVANIIAAQKIEGVAGFIQLGYLVAPNTKTFNQIYPSNVPGFANNYFLIGAEGFYRSGKHLIMGDWRIGFQKLYSLNEGKVGAFYQSIIGKYGQIIKEEKNIWFYPSIGAGASVASLTSFAKINGKEQNVNTQTLVSPSFDLGLNADFLLSKLRWKENYYLGWIMGVKAGYTFSAKRSKWKNNSNDSYKLVNAPSYTNNAFYAALSFGIGSFDKK